MPKNTVRIGPYTVFLSVDRNIALPDITAGSPPVLDVVAQTPTDYLINDVNQPLLTTDTYAVTVALVGRDVINGGYTIAKALAPVTGLTVTAGQGLYINIDNPEWPAGFNYAISAAIFLKINAGLYQLAGFAYIDPTNNFQHMIIAKPLRVAPSWDISILTAATVDPILGSRAPQGVTYLQVTPTSGNTEEVHSVNSVPVSPNDSTDFQIATARGYGIRFQALINDMKTFVQAAAGLYVSYTGDSSSVITQSHMALNTAQAILRENRACQVFLPANPDGTQEIKLLIGMLTFNQSELQAAWSKSSTTLVNFVFDPASLDRLITSQHTAIGYVRK